MALSLEEISIRPVEERDNAPLASIIRNTLVEFGAARPGTVYYDASTDALYQLFQNKTGAVYFIAEANGEVIGGGGIYPTGGLPAGTCELVKMYLLPKGRGIGLGRKIIEQCIAFAKAEGYKNIYLETMPELKLATKTYEKFGFMYLDGPMGDTGHHGCELWMMGKIKELES